MTTQKILTPEQRSKMRFLITSSPQVNDIVKELFRSRGSEAPAKNEIVAVVTITALVASRRRPKNSRTAADISQMVESDSRQLLHSIGREVTESAYRRLARYGYVAESNMDGFIDTLFSSENQSDEEPSQKKLTRPLEPLEDELPDMARRRGGNGSLQLEPLPDYPSLDDLMRTDLSGYRISRKRMYGLVAYVCFFLDEQMPVIDEEVFKISKMLQSKLLSRLSTDAETIDLFANCWKEMCDAGIISLKKIDATIVASLITDTEDIPNDEMRDEFEILRERGFFCDQSR
jgi:hypothetical protein